ncbi:MAG TPA: AI-2E family transporter [Pyrinomonadaceae bacterium]|jgi:predicted PurR-regulated permease PerM|nr:AI-2E family transporter [Pyrinomonadaceae bacterium]
MKERKIQARLLALFVATAVALYLCWLMLQPFVNVLAWAAVLVVFFYPVHRRLVARTGRPATSALLSSLFVIVVILLPLTLITFAVINQMAGVLQNLQASVATLLDPNSPVLGRLTGWLGQYVNIEQLYSQQFLLDRLKGLSGTIAGSTLGFVGGLVGVVVQIFFVIFTMYYLFRDGDRIVRALPEMLPLERAQSEAIFARTSDVISASLYGVLVIAMIQGALGGLAFWMLGLPSAIVWAVIMTFLSMIPMAGAFFVWVPAAIYLAVTGHWGKALILVAWGTLVIGTIDNFLRPKLVGERTKLHELFIFFSVLGGLKVFGVLGIVLGPVVLAITLALIDVFRHAENPRPSTLLPLSSLAEQQGSAPQQEVETSATSAAIQGQGSGS